MSSSPARASRRGRSRAAAPISSSTARVPAPAPPPLDAPPCLEAETLRIADDEFLVLSFPLPAWSLPPRLTASESWVAGHLLKGTSRAEIARLRGTSPLTIKNQIASLFAKLGIHSRLELAIFARDAGDRGNA